MNNEQLWAPWRIGYIKGDKKAPEAPAQAFDWLPGADKECFLCCDAAASDDATRRHNLVVCQERNAVAVLNRYPYNNGHLLVAPRRHVAKLQDLSDEEQLGLMRLIARFCRVFEETMRPDGFNVGLNLGRAAGAGVPGHLHWHIVPRWSGDVNFMPILAGASVLPQSLEALYELLQAAGEANEN